MKTKKKSNLRFLLLGAAVALMVYIVTDWGDLVRGFEDASAGGHYNYEQSE